MFFGLFNLPLVLSNLISAVGPSVAIVLQAVFGFIGWYLKQMWQGLQVILSNLSTLTVIIVLVGLGGWYGQVWDNKKVIHKEEIKCQEIIKKNYVPKKNTGTSATKKPSFENTFDWRPW